MIPPWTLVLIFHWGYGAAATQIPMAEESTCEIAAISAVKDAKTSKDKGEWGIDGVAAFCLRSGGDVKP